MITLEERKKRLKLRKESFVKSIKDSQGDPQSWHDAIIAEMEEINIAEKKEQQYTTEMTVRTLIERLLAFPIDCPVVVYDQQSKNVDSLFFLDVQNGSIEQDTNKRPPGANHRWSSDPSKHVQSAVIIHPNDKDYHEWD